MKKKGAIFRKSAAVMAAMAVIQIIVFFSASAASGILSSINSGEEKGLAQYAQKSGIYIRNEMLRNAALIDGIAPQFNDAAIKIMREKNISAEEFIGNTAAVSEYLEAVSGDLLEYLRINAADGVFIVICSGADRPAPEAAGSYRGVFFKDSDLFSSPEDYSDIMLLRGNSTISSRYGIPLDMNWNSSFGYKTASGDNMQYFFRPVMSAFDYPNEVYYSLGFWNSVFTVSGENKFDKYSVISYSVPLIAEGQVYGAAGVCISPKSLLSLLPAQESGGNILVTAELRAEKSGMTVNVEAANGGRVNAEPGEPLTLAKAKGSDSLYSIVNTRSDTAAEYCAAGEVELYSRTSPYYGTHWLILASEDENTLFGASKLLEKRLVSAVIISAVIGIIISIAAAKIIFSPVEQLAEDAADIRDGEVIPVAENSDYEIYVISKALNKLSEAGNAFRTELDTERERYITALQAVRSDIFEYDCENDVFTIHRFSEKDGGGKEASSSYKNFRSIVENGHVCPVEDIPLMLAFIDGQAPRRMEIRIFRQDGSLRWNDVSSRVIMSGGKAVRVIASSEDITERKEAELRRDDDERRDPVTGLYSSEYGVMLAEKHILEKSGGDYTVIVMLFGGCEEFVRRCGTFCTNGVLEEIGHAAMFFREKNDIIWRAGKLKLAMYVPKASSDKLWEDIEKFLSLVKPVYGSDDPSSGIACRIGVSLNRHDISVAEAVERAEKAAVSAERCGTYIEYYNGEKTEDMIRGDIGKLAAPEISLDSKDYIVTRNIISYTLTILARAADMRRSVDIVFRKVIRELGLKRIAMFDIAADSKLLRLYSSCSAYGESGFTVSDISVSQDELDSMSELFRAGKMIVADKHFYIHSEKLRALVEKFRENGIMSMLPVTENFRPVGCIMFSCAEEIYTEDLSETLRQLANIVSAYVMRSRYVAASNEKSDLLNRMSDEIRTPVREIIERADSIIAGKPSGGDAEEALLAIKRSADDLSGLIDSISSILENKSKQ